MDNGRNHSKVWMISGVRPIFIIMMIVCLALVVASPFRLWAGIALIVVTLIYVFLDQALEAIDWREIGGSQTERAAGPEAGPDSWQVSPSRISDVDRRLKTLRAAYYHTDAGWLRVRSARKEMQAVSAPCRPYYERMMLAERSVYTILNTSQISGVKPKEIMRLVQQLSKQIAVLVEQIQLADRLIPLYEAGSEEAVIVAHARERLIRRADRAMQVLEGAPARLLQLATASSTRGLTRLRDELRDMNTRLEGKAEAYEEMAHTLTHLEQEQARLRRG